MTKHLFFIAAVVLAFGNILIAQTWESQIVYFDESLRLVYVSDSAGNRIPDFSYAGYKNSVSEIPNVTTVKTISPAAGDNTSLIQAAIDEVGALPQDANGIRGAVLLNAGAYHVYGTIKLKYSGVILRGAGDGEDTLSNTVIRGRGNNPNQRTILVAGGGSTSYWRDEVPGSRSNIVDDTVHVGSRMFRATDPSLYSAGDNIIIYHPCSAGWLEAVNYGDPATDSNWQVGDQPIVYNRYIEKVSGDTITIDAPVFNHLVKSLSQSYVYRYPRNGLRVNIGIENLRIDIETSGGTDEAHAWNAIDLYQIEDAWVVNCTMLHFGLSGIRSNTASRITVENCHALDPVSIIEGGKRYNFNIYTGSQLILFKNCHARNGRHHYVSNGTSLTSGCVFLDCISEGAYASSEGHRWWSTGLLYDNIVELSPHTSGALLGLYNRGDYGTSHGWGAAHSVAWNSNSAGRQIIIQKPPTAQNYAVGCIGNVNGNGPYPHPAGYIEGTGIDSLNPRSLYYAQLRERLSPPAKFNIYLRTGWNMISIPAALPCMKASCLFPSAVSGAFFFTGEQYIQVDTLEKGTGYWLKFGSEQDVQLTGWLQLSDTLDILPGWNLIGTIDSSFPVINIQTVPLDILTSPFYAFRGNYYQADTLTGGVGYWVKASDAGKIILNGVSEWILSQ